MTDGPPVKIAIIGSGPAGFYTASALLDSCKTCLIDIVERLPTPYGLIRGGVAPDHQTTKRVAKKFEKTALEAGINYYGNVEVNKDVSLDEMRSLYDAVMLAVGAPADRVLGIPGADKQGVLGAAAFVGWYNGHPDFRELDPDLNVEAVCVVGNGNVALDCARVLSRSPRGMAYTDLPDHVRDAITEAPLTDIYMLGRRGPVNAAFTNVELRELGELTLAEPVVKAEQLPDDPEAALASYEKRERRVRGRNLETLADYAARPPAGKPKRLHLEFFASPVEVLGGERVEGLRCERTEVVDGRATGTGETFDIPCGMVIAAIGYRAEPIAGAPYDEKRGIIPNDDGRVEPGLYAVGWIKRGPTGVISSNRPDGEIVAEQIGADTGGVGDAAKAGRQGLEALLRERGQRWVTFEDWRRLEAMEVAAAGEHAPRRKFTTVEDMLAALDQDAKGDSMNKPKPPRAEDGAYAGDKTPQETWEALADASGAVLVDVRTDAEFAYVGVPDLAGLGKETKFAPWVLFPGGDANPNFMEQLKAAQPDPEKPVLFLCRSGVRSRFAAAAATLAGYTNCYNILEGFEGDKDPDGHRGTVGGWKVAGLPWTQG